MFSEDSSVVDEYDEDEEYDEEFEEDEEPLPPERKGFPACNLITFKDVEDV